MKVSKDEEITFVLRIVDPDKASVLCGNILASHGGNQTPFEGVVACFSGRTRPGESNPIKQRDADSDLLNEVADYLSINHLGDKEAEALLDRIQNPQS